MEKWRKIRWLAVFTMIWMLGNILSLFPDSRVQAAGTVSEWLFGDQLSGMSRQVYNEMVDTWCAGKTDDLTIKFSPTYTFRVSEELWEKDRNSCETYRSSISAIGDAVQSAYDAFIYDHPEVFWLSDVSFRNGMTLVQDGTMLNGEIKSLVIHPNERYTGAKTEVALFEHAVAQKTAEIRSKVSSGSRDAIVRAIHDTICEEVVYGSGSNAAGDIAHTAAGVFLKDRVVLCEGYAKAFKILCSQFQLPCILVIGNAQGAHMWNYVRMDDGRWYLVDVTWDDQESGIRDTYFLAGSSTIGFSGMSIGDEHTFYTDFSGAGVKNFVLPDLSAQAYDGEEHFWLEVSKKEGTCQSYGEAVYRCSVCGLEKTETLEKTDHSWGRYHSNQDATCLKDGTKTAACIYGCGKSRTVQDTGSKLKPSIRLNAAKVVLQTGQSSTALKIEKLGKGDSVVSWKSSKTSVVTVKKTGKLGVKLKAGKVGRATVTVTLKSKWKKRVEVVVQKAKVRTRKITGVPDRLKLKKGSTALLSPVRTPLTSQEKITYSSSDPKIAAVSSKGIVTGKKKGTVTITVTSGKIRKKCKITVT